MLFELTLILVKLLCAAVCIVLTHIFWQRSKLGPKEPPLITGWFPWVGCAKEYASNPVEFLKAARKKYGDIFTMVTGGRFVTVVVDPEWYPNFYNAKDDRMLFYEPLKAVRLPDALGKSFTTPVGNKLMKVVVSKLLPKFHELPQYLEPELIYHINRRMCEKEGVVEIYDFMDHTILALSMVSLCSPLAHDEVFLHNMKHLEWSAQKLIKRPGFLGFWAVNHCKSLRLPVEASLRAELERRRANGNKNLPIALDRKMKPHVPNCDLELSDFAHNPDDLMQIMLETFPEDDQLNLDSVLGMMFGAVANTNSAVVWVLVHLCRDKDLRAKLEEEIKKALKPTGGRITKDAINNMPWIEACTYEAIRMYAIVLSLRLSVEPFTYGEYEVPGDRTVAVSSQLHLNDEKCFPNPSKFDPYRFHPSNPDYDNNMKKYLGFGTGRHLCKGMNLARFEIRMIVSYMLNHFDLIGLENEPNGLPDIEWISLGLGFPMKREVHMRYKRRAHPLVAATEAAA